MEYGTKQLMPWILWFSDSEKSRSASLDLDYISRTNFMALLSSIKSRHWLVTLGIVGTFMLNLTIIASTGLLEQQLQPVSVEVSNVVTTGTFSQDSEVTWAKGYVKWIHCIKDPESLVRLAKVIAGS